MHRWTTHRNILDLSSRAVATALLGSIGIANAAGSEADTQGFPAKTESAQQMDLCLNGVDLSHWQGVVDFETLKASGIAFVFVKATQGTEEIDSNYNINIRKARAAGLAAGSYHFYDTSREPEEQFENFACHVSLLPGDLPPVVDIEIISKDSLPDNADRLRAFIRLIENRYDVKPILYSGKDFANEYLEGFGNYPLWFADYDNSEAPSLPRAWSSWTFWQHTKNGNVSGINGFVDLNRFNCDADAFERFRVKTTSASAECNPISIHQTRATQ